MLAYITFTTFCGGVYFASTSRVAQGSFVDFQDFPGGPYAYRLYTFSSKRNTVAVVAYFLATWMADAMLLWRLYILYSSKRYAWAVVAFPSLLFLASVCMSVVILHEITKPDQSFWTTSAVPFGLAYFVLSAAITIVSNFLMTIRLLVARKQHMQTMGESYTFKSRLDIVAMLIESSALYAVWSIMFIGLYAVNHPMQSIFLTTLVDIAIIAMLLIMFRVSQDRAWKADTESAFTGLEWRNTSPIRGSGRFAKPSFQSRNGSCTTRLENVVTVETFTVDDNKMRINVESP
ncbi:hypothetical protein AN958_04569 [Leucoagaricus sp. SymC.cos]|nr:hypothetical protein AN958_04569 [Leucoagaricus sp. SymC.cos]